MIDRKKLFDQLRVAPFSGGLNQGQVDGINVIIDCWEKAYRVIDPRFIAYTLATTYWEVDKTMQPIEEYGKGKGHPYGMPAGPWHMIYYGRGDVELTWMRNYARATTRLRELGLIGPDVDLVKNPELALRPDISAAILVIGSVEGWFTGKKLGDYFNATVNDPVNARRIINSLDNANTIAHIYGQFLAAVSAACTVTVVVGSGGTGTNVSASPIQTGQAVSVVTATPKIVPTGAAGGSGSGTSSQPSAPLPQRPMGPAMAFIRLLAFIGSVLFKRKG